jgi:hypothetical protein
MSEKKTASAFAHFDSSYSAGRLLTHLEAHFIVHFLPNFTHHLAQTGMAEEWSDWLVNELRLLGWEWHEKWAKEIGGWKARKNEQRSRYT